MDKLGDWTEIEPKPAETPDDNEDWKVSYVKSKSSQSEYMYTQLYHYIYLQVCIYAYR